MNLIKRPKIVKVTNIRDEARKIKTLYFNYPAQNARPGQFFMIWDFKDEIPISISYIGKNNLFGISIKAIGLTTENLISLSKGDQIGVRGPYGNPFKIIKTGKVIVVGGGIGIAPLMPLIQELVSIQTVSTTCVIGARTAFEIPFLKELQVIRSKFFTLEVCTDDGTTGHKGYVSNFVEDLLDQRSFDHIYTCGPEIMMKKIFHISEEKSIPLQASLERIMKCGIGICGQCVMDPSGLRVCRDGPVFDNKQLKDLSDFGKNKRDFDGTIQKI
ncbi:MAG: dihydroorotate dehydrogenase electron transfer subunit [Candidatus Lokiarchaeota archaeon]|nr:dihydroorotate dehydrogenase electron transfer subunit [Candidatus Lokiarchaeota archaeon]